jgi:hypothetical protein
MSSVVRGREEIEKVIDWAASKETDDDGFAEGVLQMWLWLTGELDEAPGEIHT